MKIILTGKWMGFEYEITTNTGNFGLTEDITITLYINGGIYRSGIKTTREKEGQKELLLEWMFRTMRLYKKANIFIKFFLIFKKRQFGCEGTKKLFKKVYVLEG